MPATSALTDQTPTPDLPTMIMEAPEPVWRKIATFLSVRTREEAIRIIQSNDEAANAVTNIIRSSRSALTQEPQEPPQSALTSAPAPSVAQRMYGGGGKGKARLRIE